MNIINMRSGSTEADIQAAINSLKSGGSIVLAKNDVISIKNGLNIDLASRDITLDLNGATLKQAANVGVIRVQGGNDVPRTVSLSETSDGRTAATFASLPSTVKVGDWIKVVSDNQLPGDRLDDGVTPTLLGQALEVVSIKGATVTFAGKLEYADKYVTNVRAAEINSGELVIKNGAIIGDQPKGWNQPLVQLRNLIDATVEDVTISDGSSRAINIVNSVNTLVKDVVVKNMATSGFMTGNAVHSSTSTGTTVDGLYAERVVHATDNNSIGTPVNSGNVGAYGADIGMTVKNSVAHQTTNFAWTWHSEGLNGVFDNVTAVDSHGFMNARGIGGTMTDSIGVNNTRGLLLYEHGKDDARGITLERVTVKDTATYALHVNGEPVGNKLIDTVLTGAHGALPVSSTVLSLSNSFVGKSTGSINETIQGSAGNNSLAGGAGHDIISGGMGDDTILGGHGNDVLSGGEGRDRFIFHRLEEGGDIITDFATGAQGDFIDLSVMASRLGWSRDIATLIEQKFVTLRQEGDVTLLQVNANGGGDANITIATLSGVTAAKIGHEQFILRLSDAQTDRAVTSVSTEPATSADTRETVRVAEVAPAPLQPVVPSTPAADAPINVAMTKVAGSENGFFMAKNAAEHFTGGAGLDRVDYSKSATGLVVDMSDPSASTGAAHGDRFVSVENIVGSTLSDTIIGTSGNDHLHGNSGNDVLRGGAGDDVLRGDAGDDTLIGGDGNDEMRGGDGADLFMGGAGADTFNGGAGDDIVSYAEATAGVTARIDNSSAADATSDGSGDRFYGIELVIGSRFDDVLVGDIRANRIEGGFGNDTLDGGLGIDVLKGGDGNDVLIGGGGFDQLTGGAGADTFVMGGRGTFGDRILDFETGVDKLAFTRSELGVGPEANFTLASGVKPAATGSGPAFLFDTHSSQLWFDADGAGRANFAIAVATFEPGVKLTMSDFLI